MSAELRHLIQIELRYDLESQQVTAEDTHFGIEIRWIVVVDGVISISQTRQHRIGFIDRDAANSIVNRCCAQTGHQRRAEHDGEGPEYDPNPLNQYPQVIAQDRVVRRNSGMKSGEVAGELRRPECNLAHNRSVRLKNRRWLHQSPLPTRTSPHRGVTKRRFSVWQRRRPTSLD